MKTKTMLLLAMMASTAYADPGDCPHPPKRVPPKRVPPKVVKPPIQPAPCQCKGEKGEPGDKGDVGDRGPKGEDAGNINVRVITDVVYKSAEPAIKLRLGIMGTSQAPHGDWAWGPALQLGTSVAKNVELDLSIGLADLATEDHESGYLAELALVFGLKDGLGVSVGLHRTSIDGGAHNGHIDGDYLGLTGGLVLRSKYLRLELGPTVGGLRDDSEKGTQLSYGVQASGFAGWRW